MIVKSLKTIFFALLFIWSIGAAKSSRTTEIVSFVGEDKEIVCAGNNAKWLFINSTEIDGNSPKYQITTSEHESILRVVKVDLMSAGVFRCSSQVNNSYSQKIFNLRTYYPLTMNNVMKNIVAKEGDSVLLKCKPTGIPSPKKILWFFEGEELTPGKDYSRTNEGILINNVQLEQAGTYSCLGIQELDNLKNVQEREIELIVEYAPRETETSKEPTKVFGNINETVALNCTAKSDPIARFTWLRNNYETFKNVEIRDSSTTLKVDIESEENFNETFSCLAENDYGRSIQTFIINEKPQDFSIKDSNDARKMSHTSTVLIASLMILLNYV